MPPGPPASPGAPRGASSTPRTQRTWPAARRRPSARRRGARRAGGRRPGTPGAWTPPRAQSRGDPGRAGVRGRAGSGRCCTKRTGSGRVQGSSRGCSCAGRAAGGTSPPDPPHLAALGPVLQQREPRVQQALGVCLQLGGDLGAGAGRGEDGGVSRRSLHGRAGAARVAGTRSPLPGCEAPTLNPPAGAAARSAASRGARQTRRPAGRTPWGRGRRGWRWGETGRVEGRAASSEPARRLLLVACRPRRRAADAAAGAPPRPRKHAASHAATRTPPPARTAR
jgi:hypothetical protein